MVMRPGDSSGGCPDILVVPEPRSVEHDRGEARGCRRVQQVLVLDMVQVQGDGHGGGFGDCARGGADRQHVAVVEAHGVLGDLQDHRPSSGLGTGHDRLGVFESDHVERGDSAVSAPSLVDELACRHQCHGPIVPNEWTQRGDGRGLR
jgi:hypothetical protein